SRQPAVNHGQTGGTTAGDRQKAAPIDFVSPTLIPLQKQRDFSQSDIPGNIDASATICMPVIIQYKLLRLRVSFHQFHPVLSIPLGDQHRRRHPAVSRRRKDHRRDHQKDPCERHRDPSPKLSSPVDSTLMNPPLVGSPSVHSPSSDSGS